jgi:sarcosine oxidase subunit beta
MSKNYDIAIIGAGIMGCSTGLQLAKQGLKVAILEKEGIGAGSTGKSSAVIRQHYSNPLTARLALHSLRTFQNFSDEVGGESGFTQAGFIVVVAAKDHDGLEANVAMQQGLGVNTQLISPEESIELMPGLQTSDMVAAAYEPESGYADPNLTVSSYSAAAKNAGAEIFLERAVTGICFEGEKVVGVDTASGPINAPIVLNSAGPWGARVAKMAGVDVPINSCRVQVAFFGRPDSQAAEHPVVADFIHSTYFRAETGQLTLAGLIDPAEADAIVNPDAFPEQLDKDFTLDVGERLVRRYPPMERSQARGGYASLYAITPDWHPVVDELIPDSGFFISAGFSGHGFKLGPAVGLMTADMLTANSDPLFDPSLFKLNRFQEGKEVVGQYEYSIAG